MNFVVTDEVRPSVETFRHALYSWLYLGYDGSGAWSRLLTTHTHTRFHSTVLVRPFCGVKFSFQVLWLKTSPHSVHLGSFSPV